MLEIYGNIYGHMWKFWWYMLEIYAHIPCYIMAYAEQLQIVKPAWNKKCIRHLFGDGYPIDRNVISPGSSITYPSWLAIRSQWWMVFPLQMTLTPGCNPWLFPLVTRTAPPNMVDVSSKEIGFKWCIWMYMVYIYAVYCRNTYVNTWYSYHRLPCSP